MKKAIVLLPFFYAPDNSKFKSKNSKLKSLAACENKDVTFLKDFKI